MKKPLSKTLPEVKRAPSQVVIAFGIQLREIRRFHGLSQKALAERSGTTQAEIARIEAGTANPTLRTLEGIGVGLRSQVTFGLGARLHNVPSQILTEVAKAQRAKARKNRSGKAQKN